MIIQTNTTKTKKRVEVEDGDDDDKVVKDGQSVRVSMVMMDSFDSIQRAVFAAHQVKRNEAFDAKMRNSPGFVEVTDEERAATAKVLADRDARLSNAWKHPNPTVDAAPPAKTDATQANDAESAYEARRHRLENAWRGGR
jgi:hypothetical protein